MKTRRYRTEASARRILRQRWKTALKHHRIPQGTPFIPAVRTFTKPPRSGMSKMLVLVDGSGVRFPGLMGGVPFTPPKRKGRKPAAPPPELAMNTCGKCTTGQLVEHEDHRDCTNLDCGATTHPSGKCPGTATAGDTPDHALALDRVWAALGALEPGYALYELPRPIQAVELRDAREQPVPGAEWAGQARVWFLDQEAGANWGHACRYFVVTSDVGLRILPHRLPPSLQLGELLPTQAAPTPDASATKCADCGHDNHAKGCEEADCSCGAEQRPSPPTLPSGISGPGCP